MEQESHKIHIKGWVTFELMGITRNHKDKEREAIMHGTCEKK